VIRSGVIGNSNMRTPTASYTALAMTAPMVVIETDHEHGRALETAIRGLGAADAVPVASSLGMD
jgi:hypothetical protein